MDLERLLPRVQQDLQAALGENLVSLSVLGSAAIGDYSPATSDVNLLAVLRTLGSADLESVRAIQRRLARHRLATPLLLTPDFIRDSADVFPIEFLEMRERHRVLYGPDPFADLEIKLDNLRYECEHEIKGRLLRLRQSFLEMGGGARPLRALLLAAHQANLPAFRAALRLKRVSPPLKKEELPAELARHFGLETQVFTQLQKLRASKLSFSRVGLRRLWEDYLREVDKLAQAVDRL
jgi:hypothetical protein